MPTAQHVPGLTFISRPWLCWIVKTDLGVVCSYPHCTRDWPHAGQMQQVSIDITQLVCCKSPPTSSPHLSSNGITPLPIWEFLCSRTELSVLKWHSGRCMSVLLRMPRLYHVSWPMLLGKYAIPWKFSEILFSQSFLSQKVPHHISGNSPDLPNM